MNSKSIFHHLLIGGAAFATAAVMGLTVNHQVSHADQTNGTDYTELINSLTTPQHGQASAQNTQAKQSAPVTTQAAATTTTTTATNSTAQPQKANKFNKLYKIAKSKLGSPYVWGGNGPHVFDCSGFTKYVYKHAFGKNLPRLAGDQYYAYKKVAYKHAKAGDLVFFGGSRSNITHVGMYIGHGKMIDAQLRGVIIENVIAPWWNLVGVSRPMSL